MTSSIFAGSSCPNICVCGLFFPLQTNTEGSWPQQKRQGAYDGSQRERSIRKSWCSVKEHRYQREPSTSEDGYPEGCAAPDEARGQGNVRGHRKKGYERNCPKRIEVTTKRPVESIPVDTLIRTDTTLDHNQKAEKVCSFRSNHNLCRKRIKTYRWY